MKTKIYAAAVFFILMQTLMASFTIVKPDKCASYDNFAADELALHLRKITASDVKTVCEKDYKNSRPVIFLGNTTAGKNAAKNLKSPEEWRILSLDSDSLVLTGSDPKGMLHSIYEFLEKFAGVRWFDEFNFSIPENKNFKLPSNADITGKPYFRVRHIYDTLDWQHISHVFKARNKSQSAGTPETADYSLVGSPAPHHTFNRYSSRFKSPKPEMFALIKGKGRLTDAKGQLCMTHPETRKQVLEILRGFIRADRRKAAKDNVPPPVIYDISANDVHSFCQCDGCNAIAEREGGAYSAPQLDFINYIANEIAKEYPDIFIRTFAYMHTYDPPKTMKAAKNVIIHIAILGYEFGKVGKRDTMSALNTPENAYSMQLIKNWGPHADNLAMWDYWKLWGGHHQMQDPYVNVYPIIYNMKVYKDNNIKDIFVECESPAETSFFGLKRYLGMRLMENPDRDPGKEIDIFMRGMYGKAAPVMKEYLDFLSDNQTRNKLVLGRLSTRNRTDLNGAFYSRAMKLLTRAQKLAATDSNKLAKANVEREFIPVIGSWLDRYGKHRDGKNDFDFKKMLSEYEKYSRAAIDYYYRDTKSGHYRKSKFHDRISKTVKNLKRWQLPKNVKLPKELQGKNVITMQTYHFRNASNAKFIRDRDAQTGEAIVLGKESPNKSSGNRTLFGVHDRIKGNKFISIKNADIPQDEKYHLIHIGRATMKNSQAYFFAGNTCGIQCGLDMIFKDGASDEENTYDFYASVKFSGPQYVKNSKQQESMIAVDALYAVKIKK